jgi:mRNA deadenylase 3'-5' endonuclease subunit Ccr4
MKKQKPKPASAKRKAKAHRRELEPKRSNWVEDKLEWLPVYVHHESVAFMSKEEEEEEDATDEESNIDGTNDDHGHSDDHHRGHEQSTPADGEIQELHQHHDISIISWNVLADSYCNRSSHKNLPMKFQNRVFDRKQRQHHVRQTLRLVSTVLRPDLIALQEVDPPLGITTCLKEMGYDGAVETPACPDGRNGRVDSCGLYFPLAKWKCLEHETVQLDNLATLQSGNDNFFKKNEELRRRKNGMSSTTSSNLQGLQTSFIRKNVALLVRLEHVGTGKEIVVAVAHLFWNPAYEYVKVS